MTALRYRFRNYIKTQTFSPLKKLLLFSKNYAGRNNTGHISFFAKASRVKKKYRIIDFKRLIWNLPAKILRFEYDPNRKINIALICYANGILSNILAVENIKKNKRIYNTDIKSLLKIGNTSLLSFLNEGSFLNGISTSFIKDTILVRSAGCQAILLKKYNNVCLVSLPSKEQILLSSSNIATLGRLSNIKHNFTKYYKAGQKRLLGKKPRVRGVAKNPIDHPHGGGGGRCLVTRWAKPAKNVSSRNKFKSSRRIAVSRKFFRKKIKK
jgi:large subunit ribosomal protein L2